MNQPLRQEIADAPVVFFSFDAISIRLNEFVKDYFADDSLFVDTFLAEDMGGTLLAISIFGLDVSQKEKFSEFLKEFGDDKELSLPDSYLNNRSVPFIKRTEVTKILVAALGLTRIEHMLDNGAGQGMYFLQKPVPSILN